MSRIPQILLPALLMPAIVSMLPAQATRQESRAGGAIIQVDRPVHLAAGDTVGGVVIVGDHARIDGVIQDQLLVVNGTARVTGVVRGSVTVIRGELELAPTAHLLGHVDLYQGTLRQAPGAYLAQTPHRQSIGFSFSETALLLIWSSLTLALVVAGYLFATFGTVALRSAVSTLTLRPGTSLVATLVIWLGFPLLAVTLVPTLIGLPLGIGVFVFLLPSLWFFGYLIAATWLGDWLLSRVGRTYGQMRPAISVLAGVVAMQVCGLIPGFGGLAVVLAGMLGSGALVSHLWSGHAASRAGIPRAAMEKRALSPELIEQRTDTEC